MFNTSRAKTILVVCCSDFFLYIILYVFCYQLLKSNYRCLRTRPIRLSKPPPLPLSLDPQNFTLFIRIKLSLVTMHTHALWTLIFFFTRFECYDIHKIYVNSQNWFFALLFDRYHDDKSYHQFIFSKLRYLRCFLFFQRKSNMGQ